MEVLLSIIKIVDEGGFHGFRTSRTGEENVFFGEAPLACYKIGLDNADGHNMIKHGMEIMVPTTSTAIETHIRAMATNLTKDEGKFSGCPESQENGILRVPCGSYGHSYWQ